MSPSTLSVPDVSDPPPPYPSSRTRSNRPRRHRATIPHLSPIFSDGDHAAGAAVDWDRSIPREALETTPLLTHESRSSFTRRPSQLPRSGSYSSTIRTSSSHSPSLAHTVWYVFEDEEDDSDVDVSERLLHDGQHHRRIGQHGGQHPSAEEAVRRTSVRWPFFSKPAWAWYFQPLCRRAYYAAVFQLLALNLPYALAAWIYLFVFTLVSRLWLWSLEILYIRSVDVFPSAHAN